MLPHGMAAQSAMPPPAPPAAGQGTGGGHGNSSGHSSKKQPLSLMVGDAVHFAVQDGRGSGPARHGSIVLFVDGDRALLASSPQVPNVKVVEVDGERVGMSWVKVAYLGKGHKQCLTTLGLNLDAAWGLRSKILLTAGDVGETSVLSARGSATNSEGQSSMNNSEFGSPNVPSSPAPGRDDYPQDRDLRAMVKEALQGFGSKDHPDGSAASGMTESTQAGSSTRPARDKNGSGSPGDSTMARELRALIAEAFDDGIQAFRAEQKGMDRWVGMLQERVNKVTGHFLMTFGSKMEAEMDRRLNIYADTIKTTCHQLQGLQPGIAPGPRTESQAAGALGPGPGLTQQNRVEPIDTRAVGDVGLDPLGQDLESQGGNSNAASPHKKDKPKDASKQASSSASPANSGVQIKKQTTPSEQTTVMIAQIKKDREHAVAVKQAIGHHALGHQECIPAGFAAFVHGVFFNSICAVITVCFAVMVGIEVHFNVAAELDEAEPPTWPGAAVNIFNIVFAAEILVRMVADGIVYFVGPNWRWNTFDLILVVLSIVDIVAGTGTVGFLRLVRGIQAMKALRVVRVLALFSDLRMMVTQMLHSFGTLWWSLVSLLVIIYICAVTIMQAAVVYIKDTSRTNGVAQGVREFYDSLPDAMYTMLLCITGGIEWKVAAEPIWHFGWAYGALFIGFILISILGILNVITSVFVERATNMKRVDRDFAFTEELRLMETDVEETMELFKVLDPDSKNSIWMQDVQKFLKEDRVIAHFAAMGIDVRDTTKFGHLFQEGDSGMLTTDAFVLGLMSLRGAARQSSTLSIMLAVRKLESSLHYVRTNVASDVDSAVRRMSRLVGHHSAGPRIETGVNAALQNEGPMTAPANRVPTMAGGYNMPYGAAAGITYGGSTDV